MTDNLLVRKYFVAQEEHYLDLRSRICEAVPAFAALIPVDSTQWLAAADDKKAYGMECHGQYQNFLVVVQSPEGTTNFLPDVGQEVSISLRLNYKFRPIPCLVLLEPDITENSPHKVNC
ncbi:hypothetical protein NQ176_g3248 [Zarea fungicola]|uniref:Uncharacterized protein n=1 Tax=Zarea fungicola TaxID=93591 RepID=A0ACC1NM06_9HYPO|nr:hypothetical protein NQ176_g3248 [Lecanicillium fungicola]